MSARRRAALSSVAFFMILGSCIALLLGPPDTPFGGTNPLRGENTSWLAMLPPLVAIVSAVLLRRAVLALLLGVLAGALVVAGGGPGASVRGLIASGANVGRDPGHATILLFSLALGAMMGVMQRSGGGAEFAGRVTRFATNRRRGQLTAWAMGLVIFFDDYANSMLVGSTMRPITDRLRISREKLAFIIDATAAPVASVALVSSWIGVEVGYIGQQMQALGIEGDAYGAFLASLPYRFYPWLMLFMVFYVAYSGRDFGPMRQAESSAAASTDSAERYDSQNSSDPEAVRVPAASPWLSLAPILVVVLAATLYMAFDGHAKVNARGDTITLRGVFSAASSSRALLIASVLGALTAGGLAWPSIGSRGVGEGYAEGMRAILSACFILLLAWMLGGYCKTLHTAQYLVAMLDNGLPGGLVPAAVFVLAAVVSFATGTSWGTMAILFPLALPLAHELAPASPHIFLGAISSVLSGAVWGDHCSPISDTTVISSMAAGCDHVAHVKTQLPYALLVGAVALFVCELPVGLGWFPVWVVLPLGAAAIVAAVTLLERRSLKMP